MDPRRVPWRTRTGRALTRRAILSCSSTFPSTFLHRASTAPSPDVRSVCLGFSSVCTCDSSGSDPRCSSSKDGSPSDGTSSHSPSSSSVSSPEEVRSSLPSSTSSLADSSLPTRASCETDGRQHGARDEEGCPSIRSSSESTNEMPSRLSVRVGGTVEPSHGDVVGLSSSAWTDPRCPSGGKPVVC